MTRRPSPGSDGEPRGPRVLLAGLCDQCGTVTTRTAIDGNPRHAGCDIAGHQITIDEAIANAIRLGLVEDPDVW